MKDTVTMKSGFFLTPEGEEALENYSNWDKGSSDSAEIEARKVKLLASGLVKQGAPPIEGGIGPRVLALLKTEKDGLTMAQVTEQVNEKLKEEDKGEVATVGQVRAYLNFSGKTKDGIVKKDDKYLIPTTRKK